MTAKNREPIPTLLAPMAGVTDYPFRWLTHQLGATWVVTEMVSADGIVRENPNTWEILGGMENSEFAAAEVIQLFGSDPGTLAEAVARILTRGLRPGAFDINMGCPVPKVVRSGAGAALMRTPRLAVALVQRLRAEVPADTPLWVKIRSGWCEDERNAADFARRMEAAGADALAVHARTRSAYYQGQADWSVISDVVRSVKIPVWGNGDVTDGARAMDLVESTGCQGVMVGRGAMGRPWVFGDLRQALGGGGQRCEPEVGDRLAVALLHLQMEVVWRGEPRGTAFMRKHLHWYTAGLPGSARLRAAVNQCDTWETMHAQLSSYADRLEVSLAGPLSHHLSECLPELFRSSAVDGVTRGALLQYVHEFTRRG